MRESSLTHMQSALNSSLFGNAKSQLDVYRAIGHGKAARGLLMRNWFRAQMLRNTYRPQVKEMLDAASRDNDDIRDILQRTFEHVGRLSSVNTSKPSAFLAVFDSDVLMRNVYVRVLRALSTIGNIADRDDVFSSDLVESLLERLELKYFNHALVSAHSIHDCENCGDPYIDEDLRTVTNRLGEFVNWCEGCVEEYSFYCEITCQRYTDSAYTLRTTDGGTEFCLEVCEDRYVEYDENDDTWVRRNTRGSLAPYHGAYRPWKSSQAIPMRAIGVELELGFARGSTGREKFLDNFVGTRGRFLNGLPFSCERDGSLDDVPGGMEIISDPLLLHEGYRIADAPWRMLLNALHAYGAEGWKWRAFAGIHVNMDTRHVTEEEILKYAVFISNAAALSKFISGRRKVFGRNNDNEDTLRFQQYSGGYDKKDAKAYRRLPLGRALDKVFEQSKYAPVHRRTADCLETRIFGSNIKYEGFMACVEYCVAVMDFVHTRDTQDIFSPTISAEFRHWLGSCVGKYPNLAARIGVVPTIGAATASTAKIIPLRAVA